MSESASRTHAHEMAPFLRHYSWNLQERGYTMHTNKILATYQDYVLIRVDPKTNLQVWVKLPPNGR